MSRPRRHLAIVLAMIVMVSTGSVITAAPATASSVAAVEVEVQRLVNQYRAQHGRAPLRVDVRLVASARSWSGHMAATGSFRHDPNLDRAVPPGATAWGENVAYTTASSNLAQHFHNMFVGSADHRANLLDRRFTDLGIGVATGGGRTYVTQRLTAGAPARVAAAVEPTAELAESHFGGTAADYAVIARDDVYADALAAGPLAGRSGPLLLTPVGPALHPRVRLALERTVPRGRTVWIAGGTAAVTSGVEAEIKQAGWQTRRLAGGNRFQTAAAIARAVAERDGPPDEVLVATGAGWADAAAGGAYGARAGAPVLLALRNSVPAETDRMLRDLRPSRVIALGGTAVLSDATVKKLDARRVSGATRQGTSAGIAEVLWGHSSTGPARWVAVPAFGDDAWTWALGVAPAAARRSAPVLLVGPEVSQNVLRYLSGLGYGGNTTADLVTYGPVPEASAAKVRALLR